MKALDKIYISDRPYAMRKSNTLKAPGRRRKTTLKANRRFTKDFLAAIHENKFLWIRAGTQPHRFIGIWVVVVEGRVFVRSWSLKPKSWFRTFCIEPRGAIKLADREMPVRAKRQKSESLNDAIDLAYLEKYGTPGSMKYARDLGRAKSRATTTELVPL
jgi:hypothetical protein